MRSFERDLLNWRNKAASKSSNISCWQYSKLNYSFIMVINRLYALSLIPPVWTILKIFFYNSQQSNIFHCNRYIRTVNNSFGQFDWISSFTMCNPAFSKSSRNNKCERETLKSALSTKKPVPQWFYLKMMIPPSFNAFLHFFKNAIPSSSVSWEKTHWIHIQSYFSSKLNSCKPWV